MKRFLAAAALIVSAGSALAQTPIGPFTGQQQEGFEGPQVVFTACMTNRVFNNTADLCTPGSTGCLTTTGWSFQCVIFPNGGSWFFGSAGCYVEYTFDNPATRFGGFFGVNSGFADATVDFLDSNGALIGTQTAAIPADCAWHWNGWSIPGAGAKTIRITGLNPYCGGFVDMDDMEADYTAAGPATYCTAGTTSNGCVPAISASGNPNVAQTAPCIVTVNGVEGQKSGIIFYGLNQVQVPWCSGGGGSSFLCVKAPTMRTGTQNSGGTSGQCDGTLSLDWEAFQNANPSALGNPWAAGAKADVQGWFRDPPSCKTTSLSDAVELTYQP